MEQLLARTGGIVTKSALSKYELGKDVPSSAVGLKLAAALGVKVNDLLAEPALSVEFTGYRSSPRMTQTEREQTEAAITLQVERRLRVAELLCQRRLPLQPHSVDLRTLPDAEAAAEKLRRHWKLGTDPLVAPITCLEANGVHVIEHQGPPSFTGLSGIARDSSGKPLAVIVVCRVDQCGERQGLTAFHEVGHIYCRVPSSMPEKEVEHLMFSFSRACHAPADAVRHAFGTRRTHLSLEELIAQKSFFRLSVSAMVYRLRDLEIISENVFQQMFRLLNKLGWREKEPQESLPERPTWLRAATLRLLNEGVISHLEAERTLGEKLEGEPEELRASREFLRLPLEQRRKLLGEAADRSREYYRGVADRGEVDVADLE